jgi:hypothetical protein
MDRVEEGVVVEDVGHQRSAAGGFCELGGGVEGETDMPPLASSSSGVDRVFDLTLRVSSSGGWLPVGGPGPFSSVTVEVGVVWPFMVALESGVSGSTGGENEAARPLLLLLPLIVMMSPLCLR